MKTQTQLKSPVVYRVKDKTTGRTLGYLKPIRITCYTRRYEQRRNQETKPTAHVE